MTLRSKLLLFVLPYAAATAALTTILGYLAVRRVLLAAEEARSRAILVGFDEFPKVVAGLERRDGNTLRDPLLDLVAGQALSAAALDPEGRVIARFNRGERAGAHSGDAASERLRPEALIAERVKIHGQDVIRATLPVPARGLAGSGKPNLGAIQVLFSLEPSMVTARQLSARLAAIIIGSMAIGAGFLLFALSSLLRPLLRLSGFVKSLTAGAFGDTLEAGASDEIGELGLRFNELSRRLAETTISRDYFEDVLDSVLSGVIVVDSRGRIERLNDAAKAVLCADGDPPIGQPFRKFLARSSLTNTRRGAGRLFAEASLITPSGGVPALVGISRLLARGGRRKLIVWFRDISRLKRAQNELMLANARLDEFVRITAHDLHERIRKLALNSERLARAGQALPADLQRSTATIGHASLEMNTVVGALLTYSAIGLGDERPARVSLSEAFDAAAKQLADDIAAEKAALSRDDLPVVLMRPSHARELFSQLLANALRFRSQAAPKIHAASECRGRKCVVSVSDNGIGIEPAAIAMVFRPFARIHPGHPKRGPGVGLAICRRIVELAGGAIRVTSTPGLGSTFWLSFPEE